MWFCVLDASQKPVKASAPYLQSVRKPIRVELALIIAVSQTPVRNKQKPSKQTRSHRAETVLRGADGAPSGENDTADSESHACPRHSDSHLPVARKRDEQVGLSQVVLDKHGSVCCAVVF